jgi:KDO2-lipid IV(A) lauroyltransferase
VRGTPLDLLAYAALRAVETILLSMPPRGVERAARAVGRAWFRLDRARRSCALENLLVAFPSIGEEGRRRIARAAFEHAFVVATEVVVRPRTLRRGRDLRRHGRFVGDQATLRGDIREGKAGLVLTAHVGNWELAGAVFRLEGVPFCAVARPIENPYVDAYVARTRGGPDAVITKRGAVRAVARALEQGRWVGVLADQNAGRHGVFVPFFGLPASTYPFAATLAVRLGVPVYFGTALRRGSGFRYDYVVARHPVARTGDDRADARRLLADFHAWLEDVIRARPEQYLWLHRRWRSRPADEPAATPVPSYARRKVREGAPLSSVPSSPTRAPASAEEEARP